MSLRDVTLRLAAKPDTIQKGQSLEIAPAKMNHQLIIKPYLSFWQLRDIYISVTKLHSP